MLASRLPANTLQGMMDLCCQALCDDGDTFYSQRVFDLFPQMATTNSGWSTHTAQANSIFGSTVNSGATNNGDYIEWTVYLPAGSFKLVVEHETSTDRGRADLSVDGGAVVSQMDQYSVSATRNVLHTSSAFTVTEGSHTIRLTKNGKNASSSAYTLSAQHCQLIKQDATSAIASVANVPHIINVPIVFADSHTNWNTLSMATSYKFGTGLVSSGAQNATVTFSFWAPKGAFTLAFLYVTNSNIGIYSATVDGNSIGTVDGYTAGATYNNLSTGLTGTLTSTGMHTLTFTMATKHASSSSYVGTINHAQIRMTSITEPLSADLAPEVALFWPVFNEAATGLSVVTASANSAYFYWVGNAGTQNDEITLSTNSVLRPGTYRLDVVTHTWTNRAKMHVLVDSVDLGNYDAYAGAVYNVVGTVSGLVLTGFSPHTIKLKLSSKNASSSSYFGYAALVRLIRTGA